MPSRSPWWQAVCLGSTTEMGHTDALGQASACPVRFWERPCPPDVWDWGGSVGGAGAAAPGPEEYRPHGRGGNAREALLLLLAGRPCELRG